MKTDLNVDFVVGAMMSSGRRKTRRSPPTLTPIYGMAEIGARHVSLRSKLEFDGGFSLSREACQCYRLNQFIFMVGERWRLANNKVGKTFYVQYRIVGTIAGYWLITI